MPRTRRATVLSQLAGVTVRTTRPCVERRRVRLQYPARLLPERFSSEPLVVEEETTRLIENANRELTLLDAIRRRVPLDALSGVTPGADEALAALLDQPELVEQVRTAMVEQRREQLLDARPV
jgi:hypothetical protein